MTYGIELPILGALPYPHNVRILNVWYHESLTLVIESK